MTDGSIRYIEYSSPSILSPIPAPSQQDLGLETPNWYGYTDYDDIIQVMDVYIRGVEATSGEVVLKVPPKPSDEVPRGMEEVAQYLHAVSLKDVCVILEGVLVAGGGGGRGRRFFVTLGGCFFKGLAYSC